MTDALHLLLCIYLAGVIGSLLFNAWVIITQGEEIKEAIVRAGSSREPSILDWIIAVVIMAVIWPVMVVQALTPK